MFVFSLTLFQCSCYGRIGRSCTTLQLHLKRQFATTEYLSYMHVTFLLKNVFSLIQSTLSDFIWNFLLHDSIFCFLLLLLLLLVSSSKCVEMLLLTSCFRFYAIVEMWVRLLVFWLRTRKFNSFVSYMLFLKFINLFVGALTFYCWKRKKKLMLFY